MKRLLISEAMGKSSYTAITVERRGAADWVTLNRPDRLNALNHAMVEDLLDYFGSAVEDTARRVIVLRGAGRAFCAGVDIKETTIARHKDAVEGLTEQRRFSEIIRRMRRCPQPVIALVHGPASGGGFSIALAADVRIAGETARMNAAFIRIGFSGSDMGSSYFLPRLVGLSVASELLLTGRFVDAERALRSASYRRWSQTRGWRPPARRSSMTCWRPALSDCASPRKRSTPTSMRASTMRSRSRTAIRSCAPWATTCARDCRPSSRSAGRASGLLRQAPSSRGAQGAAAKRRETRCYRD